MFFNFGSLVLLKQYLWIFLAIAIIPLLIFTIVYDQHSSNLRQRLLEEKIESDLSVALFNTNNFIDRQKKILKHITSLPNVNLIFSDSSEQQLPATLLDSIYYEIQDSDFYSLLFFDSKGVFIRSFPYWLNQSKENIELINSSNADDVEKIQWVLPTTEHAGYLLLKKSVLKDGNVIGIMGIKILLASMTQQAKPLYLSENYEPLFITPNNVVLSTIGHVTEPATLLIESDDFLPGWSIALQRYSELNEPSDISIRVWLLLAVATSIIGVTLLFLSMMERLAQMIAPLKEGARAIANGDLNVVVPEDGLGEIGSLGRSFNEMSRQLDTVISSRVVAERQAALGILAAGIAHEVRNPLSTVLATVHGLFRLENDYKKKEMLRVINSEVVRTDLIVEEFMNYARPREPQKKMTPIDDVLEKVCVLTSASALEQGVKISKLGDTSVKVFIDSGQLSQILMNLVLNGLQAMSEGGHIIFRVHKTNDKVHLSITDTGHGIPQDQFDKILAPFFTTKKQGTGLGLSICMRLVKANDGVMEIESVEGRGTVVTLVFLAENKVKERGCNDHE